MNNHENDLAYSETELNVYILEHWTNYTVKNGKDDAENHLVSTTAVFSTYDKAVEFCVEHPDYGGTQNDWHWCVRREVLDCDPLRKLSMPTQWHLNPATLEPCNTKGSLLNNSSDGDSIEDAINNLELIAEKIIRRVKYLETKIGVLK